MSALQNPTAASASGGTSSSSSSVAANETPTADAGDDQTGIDEGDLVTLDGSGSSDPEAAALTYAWSVTSVTGGEIVVGDISLSSTTVVGPTFTAPNALADYIVTFSLTVSDGTNTSVADTVDVTITCDNDAPTLTTVNTLAGATEDTDYSITYATLLAAANEADVDSSPISFRVEAVSTGTLKEGGADVTEGVSLLSVGETWVWKGVSNANGTLNAFTVVAWDDTSASAAAIQVKVDTTAVNDIPTLTTVNTLAGASEDTAYDITYAALIAAANEADVDGDTLSFRVEEVSSGGLKKDGNPVVEGTSLLSTGETLVWTPAANAYGTINAFTVVAWDGTSASAAAIQVKVTVTQLADDALSPTSWPFTTSTNYTYDTNKIEFTAGVASLTALDQVDDDNNATTGFDAGTHMGTAWDAGNSYIEITDDSDCDGTGGDGSGTNCSEFDSSWTPQYANIVGYWRMNGTVGAIADSATVADVLGNTDLTASDAGGAAMAYENARLKQGIHIGPDGDFVVNNSPHANMNVSRVTVSVWAKSDITDYVSYGIMTYRAMTINSTIVFCVSPASDEVEFQIKIDGDEATYHGVEANKIIDTNWHHYVGTYDGTTIKMYVDGVLQVDTEAVGGGSGVIDPDNPAEFTMGGNYDGVLDEVAIWSEALSQTEVDVLYSRQAPKYAGTYTSRIIDVGADLGASATWTSFAWIPTLPFFKELPDGGAANSETTTNYAALVGSTGNLDDDDLLSGIVGLWHFDNEVDDDSGLAPPISGTLVGNATYSTLSKLGTHSLTLDGSGDYFNLGDVAKLEISGAMSISAWVKSNSATKQQIVCRWDSTNTEKSFEFFITSGGLLQFDLSSDGSTTDVSLNSASTINDGHWHHVAGVYTGADAYLYIDGAEVDTAVDNNGILAGSTEKIFIGAGYEPAPTSFFKGNIDEVAIWSRGLHATEVEQLYRRGANRIMYQVRSCDDAACSGESWVGPDGLSTSYLSEVYNTSTPEGAAGNVQSGLPTMTYSDFTQLSPSNNRYFQYRFIMESDNTNIAMSPQLKSATVGPNHYDNTNPTIVNKAAEGVDYMTTATFTETAVTCSGTLKYQLSPDSGATWYWYTGGTWTSTATGYTEANSDAELTDAAISNFSTQLGDGTLWLKTFLNSNGMQACEVDEITITGGK